MKRISLIILPLILVMVTFLSGCSFEESTRESELQDELSSISDELNSTFSSSTGQYSLVAEYLESWANKNDIKIAESKESYMVLVNPASEGCGDSQTTVLQCAVETAAFNESMQSLSIALASLLGPEAHGDITLIVTENNDGQYTGAADIDAEYLKADNFININQSDDVLLYTGGAYEMTSTMSTKLTTASPSYTKAYTVTLSISGYHDFFAAENQYPDPIETLGSLLATAKSSGILFQLSSFECDYTDGYTPTKATFTVVIDENNVNSFTSKFNSSYNKIKKKFEKLEDNFVYTMTETTMPSTVIDSEYSDRIISLMYTLNTGTYLQDEDSGEIISASHIASVSTKSNSFSMKLLSRSLQEDVLDEMSSTYEVTSGLCSISYKASDVSSTWTSDEEGSSAAFFTDALGTEDSIVASTLESSECNIFASRGVSDIVSYRCTASHSSAALTNITNFLSSLVEE